MLSGGARPGDSRVAWMVPTFMPREIWEEGLANSPNHVRVQAGTRVLGQQDLSSSSTGPVVGN